MTSKKVLQHQGVIPHFPPTTTDTGCSCKSKQFRKELDALQRRVKKLESNRGPGNKPGKKKRGGASGALLEPARLNDLNSTFQSLSTTEN